MLPPNNIVVGNKFSVTLMSYNLIKCLRSAFPTNAIFLNCTDFLNKASQFYTLQIRFRYFRYVQTQFILQERMKRGRIYIFFVLAKIHPIQKTAYVLEPSSAVSPSQSAKPRWNHNAVGEVRCKHHTMSEQMLISKRRSHLEGTTIEHENVLQSSRPSVNTPFLQI